MAIIDDRLLSLMSRRMGYLSDRQSVLAQNIANADTPKYKAKDLAPFTFSDAMSQARGMSVTNPMHIVPANLAGVNAQTIKVKTAEVLPSGNSVDLEEQAMQVSKTAIDYQSVTAMYKKVTGWFRLAIGRGSGV